MTSINPREIERMRRSLALRVAWELTIRSENFHPEHNRSIIHHLEKIMATQAELAQQLREVLASLHKSNAEIAEVQTSVVTLTTKIAELQAIIDAGNVSQELQDAVAAVSVAAKEVDDAIPDAIPVP